MNRKFAERRTASYRAQAVPRSFGTRAFCRAGDVFPSSHRKTWPLRDTSEQRCPLMCASARNPSSFGVEARCVLRSHQFGWELCLQIGISREFVQTKVCRKQDDVLTTGELWKAAMTAKGWT
jgi:hypothetical protein